MDAKYDQKARADVQATLSMVPHFAAMSSGDQLDLYRQLVSARADELQRRDNGERSQAMLLPDIGGLVGGDGGAGRQPGDARKASELIDEKRHRNTRIDQLGDIASDFIDAVDFPTFVSDLLDGVFKANLKVTKDQMVAYQELLKAATQSLAFFMKKIPPQESFAYLAANNEDDFSINFPPDSPAELTDKDGNVLAKEGEETEDAAVKAKIVDATLAMAKEQRAMLREILLMGVTRLVVEKGVIRASVKFDFKATENIDRQDKAMVQDTRSWSKSRAHSGGFFGEIFGGPQSGSTQSGRHAQLSVATTKSDTDTSVTANLQGFVEITFKSDYFRLDNFAAMYGPAAHGPAQAAPGGLVPPPGVAPPAPPPNTPGQGR
ncbi:hypothetical protein IU486_31225 [Streptomyces gardneri]|uniref:hypothetical protein n=1 Tax=Nocardia abscessus TaxID=120957 RepID=UPI0018938B99|nr:hypothetical protein [Nocardia abscessus]MBF6169175.1 hypothetical protein [Streptomyces gardneri]MBF6475259.1 hypothetical protein [Nocardia abscessus]